ncbi:MAG: NAD-dependent epimerase/dehydratase family protein [Bacteroidota bacterium]
MSITAIIFGATGMVGEGVLHVALNNPDVETVLVIGRRTCGIQHPKLKELIHSDFYNFSSVESQLKGYTACYFCLGVSSVGKSEQEYRRTTYDLTMHAATTLARLNPNMTFCYISGAGTDSTESGRSMWARVKGKTENDLMKLPFKAVFNFRPGYIKPIKGLKNALPFTPTIGLFYPLLKSLFPNFVCTLEEIGLAMIRLTKDRYSKTIIDNNDITSLAKQL